MFFMHIHKLLSFVYASGFHAGIVWLLNKELFSLNYFFMPFMSAARQYRVYVSTQSEVCSAPKYELILENALEFLSTNGLNEGEICLHKFHQWKSMPFVSGTTLLQKRIAKVVPFHFHPSTNWPLIGKQGNITWAAVVVLPHLIISS